MKFQSLLVFLVVTTNGVAALNGGGSPALIHQTNHTPRRTSKSVVVGADPSIPTVLPTTTTTPFTRSQFLQQAATATLASTTTMAWWVGRPQNADAAPNEPDTSTEDVGQAGPTPTTSNSSVKRTNLSDDEMKDIVRSDVVEHKFLTNGKLTRSIYDESATFTDEIDTYTMDKWSVGTQKLFVGDKSRVDLVGDISVNKERVEFRFDEDLMFNLPLVKPVVHLTGKVVLQRSPETGLITSYQEFWDQDVTTVLKSAKF